VATRQTRSPRHFQFIPYSKIPAPFWGRSPRRLWPPVLGVGPAAGGSHKCQRRAFAPAPPPWQMRRHQSIRERLHSSKWLETRSETAPGQQFSECGGNKNWQTVCKPAVRKAEKIVQVIEKTSALKRILSARSRMTSKADGGLLECSMSILLKVFPNMAGVMWE